MQAVFSSVIAAMMLTVASAGCGGPVITDVTEFDDLYPVSGQISFQGQPIPGASVRLFPVGARTGTMSPDVHTAVVDEDGRFEVHTFRAAGRGQGVPAGDYLITASWLGADDGPADVSQDDRPELLPAKYTRPQTSGLTATVGSGGLELPQLDLKK